MFVLSIAGGLAFTYKDFLTNEKYPNATIYSVISGNWKCFKNDFRLIKPKKFGF